MHWNAGVNAKALILADKRGHAAIGCHLTVESQRDVHTTLFGSRKGRITLFMQIHDVSASPHKSLVSVCSWLFEHLAVDCTDTIQRGAESSSDPRHGAAVRSGIVAYAPCLGEDPTRIKNSGEKCDGIRNHVFTNWVSWPQKSHREFVCQTRCLWSELRRPSDPLKGIWLPLFQG